MTPGELCTEWSEADETVVQEMRKEINDHAVKNVDLFVTSAAAELSDSKWKASANSMGSMASSKKIKK